MECTCRKNIISPFASRGHIYILAQPRASYSSQPSFIVFARPFFLHSEKLAISLPCACSVFCTLSFSTVDRSTSFSSDFLLVRKIRVPNLFSLNHPSAPFFPSTDRIISCLAGPPFSLALNNCVAASSSTPTASTYVRARRRLKKKSITSSRSTDRALVMVNQPFGTGT
jgi:hypothetical protein